MTKLFYKTSTSTTKYHLYHRKTEQYLGKYSKKRLKKLPAVAIHRGGFFKKKYVGKELDAETGLYYYGARYLDPRVSRWLSGDPAMYQGDYLPGAPINDEARKRNGNLPGMGGVFNYVNMHVYHYAANNPIRYTDPNGRSAGDEFDTIEGAAFDFAHTYNDYSIATGREYGSTIYSYVNKDGVTKYSYTIPNRGSRASRDGSQGVNVSSPRRGQSAVATIHTHGNLDIVDRTSGDHSDANYPSHSDARSSRNSGLPAYVVGPSGVLSVFDPRTMEVPSSRARIAPNRLLTTPENNNIPKDGNDLYNPGNNNFVNRNNYNRDPFFISQRYNIIWR